MAEKKFADKLDRRSYAFGFTIANNFLRSGVKSINHEIFYKLISTFYCGQNFGVISERERRMAIKVLEESNPYFQKSNTADDGLMQGIALFHSPLCIQQIAIGGI